MYICVVNVSVYLVLLARATHNMKKKMLICLICLWMETNETIYHKCTYMIQNINYDSRCFVENKFIFENMNRLLFCMKTLKRDMHRVKYNVFGWPYNFTC